MVYMILFAKHKQRHRCREQIYGHQRGKERGGRNWETGIPTHTTDTTHKIDRGFPGGSVVKNPPANAGDLGDMGSIPGLGRSPRGGNGNPHCSVFLPEKSHGQRRLGGHRPWGHRESDTTEWLSIQVENRELMRIWCIAQELYSMHCGDLCGKEVQMAGIIHMYGWLTFMYGRS